MMLLQEGVLKTTNALWCVEERGKEKEASRLSTKKQMGRGGIVRTSCSKELQGSAHT